MSSASFQMHTNTPRSGSSDMRLTRLTRLPCQLDSLAMRSARHACNKKLATFTLPEGSWPVYPFQIFSIENVRPYDGTPPCFFSRQICKLAGYGGEYLQSQEVQCLDSPRDSISKFYTFEAHDAQQAIPALQHSMKSAVFISLPSLATTRSHGSIINWFSTNAKPRSQMLEISEIIYDTTYYLYRSCQVRRRKRYPDQAAKISEPVWVVALI